MDELGELQRMLRESKDSRMTSFFRHNFSGVSARASKEICEAAEISERRNPKIKPDEIRSILEAFQGENYSMENQKLLSPTNCLHRLKNYSSRKDFPKQLIQNLSRP